MPVSQADLAKRWGLSAGRISQLVSAGMPLDSIEAAEDWRTRRHQDTGIAPADHKISSQGDALEEEEPSVMSPDGFTEVLERQRYLVKIARHQYMMAVKDKSPQQARLYASYDKTIKTLTALEKEARERAIANREYVRVDLFLERYGKIMAEIRQMLDQSELEVAPLANPEDPARAMKAMRTWKEKMLKTISDMEQRSGGDLR